MTDPRIVVRFRDAQEIAFEGDLYITPESENYVVRQKGGGIVGVVPREIVRAIFVESAVPRRGPT